MKLLQVSNISSLKNPNSSLSPSVRLSVFLSFSVSISLSLSICLSVCLSVCLFVSLSVYFSLSLHLSVSPFLLSSAILLFLPNSLLSRNHFRMISKPDIGRRSVFFQSIALLEPYQLTGRKTPSYVLFQSFYLKERLNLGKPAFNGSCSYVFQPVMSRAALFVRVPTSHVPSGIVRTCFNQSCPQRHSWYVFQPVMSTAAFFCFRIYFSLFGS